MILPCSILFCMHVLRSKNGQREQSALLQPHTQSIERILELNANVIAMDHRHRWCCECSSAGNARTTYSSLAKNIALEGSKSCACNWKSLSLGKKFIWADNTHIFEHNEDSLRIFFFLLGIGWTCGWQGIVLMLQRVWGIEIDWVCVRYTRASLKSSYMAE